jgi:hypothetical protein
MSALGQKRTFEHDYIMSALPPKADIAKRDRDVRFVPKWMSAKCQKATFPDWCFRLSLQVLAFFLRAISRAMMLASSPTPMSREDFRFRRK